ncbi:GNAT family N-acetyltransferase [Asanoa sp. WMMD1127]|uniref:GNAT family N-acetyltransferase n=1 Tax=Asanoa sp. WMMD1127 TaxID=3016107 RepID=UPI002415EB3E|nr:GNAT family N-acetyltransferase [Asanoa sp. WMMD1127]MDG4827094.1 GNAT family N-acetyltransferase [Asanoa sp. WMMD1127]
MRFRPALNTDAPAIAALHADSWRRFYRGAYTDAYLDGDVLADRLAVWTDRLADPDRRQLTIVAEPGKTDEPPVRHPDVAGAAPQSGTRQPPLAGFVHVYLDHDERWGSLVDNLHVADARRRGGLGSTLITRAARHVADRATTPALYLWVQEQNTAAQAFYAAHGGQVVERARISDPGGVPGRLNGRPTKLRITWPDARAIAHRP